MMMPLEPIYDSFLRQALEQHFESFQGSCAAAGCWINCYNSAVLTITVMYGIQNPQVLYSPIN